MNNLISEKLETAPKLIFDIGFYDGKDSSYYLRQGCKVVAFEADPLLCKDATETFASYLLSGQLELYNVGVGPDSGDSIEFFLHKDSREWSTFYREAAQNWGKEKFEIIRVPCITPNGLFEKYGVPYYLKADIEGYDIFIARELSEIISRPEFVSFESSHPDLISVLLQGGYKSFKFVDQAHVPLQKRNTPNGEWLFEGGSGPYGHDLEGPWLSGFNISYLNNRFNLDPFGSTASPGHWYDIHASLNEPSEPREQIEWMNSYISQMNGHGGIYRKI